MANDLFGGLGGLVRGLSGFMPQDDPDVKLMNLQTRLGDLRGEETAALAEVGKQALAEFPGRFPEQEAELARVRGKLAAAEAELKGAQQARQQTEQAQKREEALCTCPRCGFRNPDGVRFCQECGAKLGPAVCRACGAELAPGTRFCGACGAKQED